MFDPITIVSGITVAAFFIGLFGARTAPNADNLTAPDEQIPSPENCEEACTEWDVARGQVCLAAAVVEIVQADVDFINTGLGAATAAVEGLAAAIAATIASGAAAIPFIGQAIVGALAILYTVAQGIAAGLLGALITRRMDLANARRLQLEWQFRVNELRDLVINNCSQDEADSCLSRTAPCY